MFLPRLHLPFISAGCFGAVIGRMLEFVSLRVRRSDQGMTPSLSPGLRAQTIALHRRLTVLAGEFHRLARLARDGRLRVYPDRASPAARPETTGMRQEAARHPRAEPASSFGASSSVAHGAMLPALATRGFGWMLGFLPGAYRDVLAGLLRNPDMVTLIQASPAAAGLLRSLCHGLGVARPEGIFPAPRRRRSRATPRSTRSGRMDLDGGADRGGASMRREPAIIMSAQARDRWWAERRGGGRSADDATGAGVRVDAPSPGRCAKR